MLSLKNPKLLRGWIGGDLGRCRLGRRFHCSAGSALHGRICLWNIPCIFGTAQQRHFLSWRWCILVGKMCSLTDCNWVLTIQGFQIWFSLSFAVPCCTKAFDSSDEGYDGLLVGVVAVSGTGGAFAARKARMRNDVAGWVAYRLT